MVSSTTPSDEARCPPVFETVSIINPLISDANSSSSFILKPLRSSGLFILSNRIVFILLL